MRRSGYHAARRTLGALFGALLLGLAGCQSETAPEPAASSSSAASSSPAPPARPSGLTGSPTGIGRPQLAVKIDNTRAAHPQIGVGDADIVYVEQVEGQLTRLLAIFSSTLPAEVGPVRSARETDLEVLGQYGRVGFAFSGANRGVARRVAAAALHDVSAEVVPAAYFRSSSRRLPYNLILRPERALDARPAAPATDIGLRFAATVPTAGRATSGFSVRYGPSASVAAAYQPATRRWQIRMDARLRPTAGGAPVAPSNVIVQYVPVRPSAFRDVLGNVTPYSVTIGTGTAVVFRDGRALAARWTRRKLTAGTRFLDAGGADVALRPGRTWILLVPVGTPLGGA